MTQIDFYFNAANKYRLAARLGAKSQEQATRMLLLTPDAKATAEMEHLLWTGQQTSFLPHCRSGHPLAAETPLIVDHDDTVLVHDDILLNLREAQPAFFSRFQRLIEIVSLDEADKAAARARYKFYRDRGYEIRQHDMTGKQL